MRFVRISQIQAEGKCEICFKEKRDLFYVLVKKNDDSANEKTLCCLECCEAWDFPVWDE